MKFYNITEGVRKTLNGNQAFCFWLTNFALNTWKREPLETLPSSSDLDLQDLPKPVRANFILNVETDELSITAGLQDRVVQVCTT